MFLLRQGISPQFIEGLEPRLAWKTVEGVPVATTGFCGSRPCVRMNERADYVLGPDGRTVYCARDVSSPEILDSFHRFVTPLFLHHLGFEVMHASSVQTSSGVIGFCADSGTGKSTAAFLLSMAGFDLWADDSLVIATDPLRGPEALGLPFRPRLRGEARKALGLEHVAFDLATPRFRGSPRAPFGGLVVLARTEESLEGPKARRLLPQEAFRRVFPHAYSFDADDRGRARAMIEAYARICAHVPVVEFSFHPSWDHRDAFVQRLVEVVEGMAAGGVGRFA